MKKYLLVILSLVFFSSCKIGEKYTKIETDMPDTYIGYAQDTACWAELKWWEIYADTNLRNLINNTLENKKNVDASHVFNFEERSSECLPTP